MVGLTYEQFVRRLKITRAAWIGVTVIALASALANLWALFGGMYFLGKPTFSVILLLNMVVGVATSLIINTSIKVAGEESEDDDMGMGPPLSFSWHITGVTVLILIGTAIALWVGYHSLLSSV